MYCRSCGNEINNDDATVCIKCGVPMGKGKNFCPTCGEPVNPEAIFCVSCGVALATKLEVGEKSKLAAGLLGIFLGAIGVHNFYLGYTKRAVAQLVLFLSFMVAYGVALTAFAGFLSIGVICFMVSKIWSFIEAIKILCGARKLDGKGRALKD